MSDTFRSYSPNQPFLPRSLWVALILGLWIGNISCLNPTLCVRSPLRSHGVPKISRGGIGIYDQNWVHRSALLGFQGTINGGFIRSIQHRNSLSVSSEPWRFSFLYGGGSQDDDILLSYLPGRGRDYLPPKTRDFLRRLTSEYVYGESDIYNRQLVEPGDIMAIIEEEYDHLNVPLLIGTTSFADQRLVKMLSFAVIHQLPKEIARLLLESAMRKGSEQGNTAKFLNLFEESGWDQVIFPEGLGLRFKKKFLVGTRKTINRFAPLSRAPWRSKQIDRRKAKQGVLAAAKNKAPERKMMSKEEFLFSMEQELISTPMKPTVTRDVTLPQGRLPSFPNRRPSLKQVKQIAREVPISLLDSWKRSVGSQQEKLQETGRSGFIAYTCLNCLLYVVGVRQWRNAALRKASSMSMLGYIIRKFGVAFITVYCCATLVKPLRLMIASTLAPTAEFFLAKTREKMGVSNDIASVLLVFLLLNFVVVALAATIIRDGAVLRRGLSAVPDLIGAEVLPMVME